MTCLSMSDPDNSGSDRITADVLVLGGIVVTMDERRTILPDGALAIHGDSIVRSALARRLLRPTVARLSSTPQGAW